jgi:hypothetical protein
MVQFIITAFVVGAPLYFVWRIVDAFIYRMNGKSNNNAATNFVMSALLFLLGALLASGNSGIEFIDAVGPLLGRGIFILAAIFFAVSLFQGSDSIVKSIRGD